jgi:elongation factor 1-alpha
LAIAAGLESMRVRLGNGFVSASLDKRVQRIIAQLGPWARSMLSRKCLLGETPRDDNVIITLVILEDHIYKKKRNEFAQNLARENENGKSIIALSSTKIDIEERLYHNENDEDKLYSEITVNLTAASGNIVTLKSNVLTENLYTPVVESYTIKVLADDLDDALDRMRDPLSYCSFLDLIRDNNTLLSYLYKVSSDQSMGLLYNAKEMLHVMSGGSECTSFGYFRLFWRLAEKLTENGTQCVKVPGHFHTANSALPIAPEPLTNLVLSNLLPGLISEFITGTPMAPLTEIGVLYSGYLLMHIRSELSSLDVARIGEIMATMRCWINNPKTKPKIEEFNELLQNLAKNGGIGHSDSPGKNMPVKAYVFSLLDESVPALQKWEALYTETFRRNMRLICGKIKGTNQKISEKLKANQITNRKFVKTILIKLAEKSKIDPGPDPDIPQHVIATSLKIHDILTSQDPDTLINYIVDNLSVFIESFCWIFIDISKKAFSKGAWWSTLQRMYYVWHVISGYSINELLETFAKFKSPQKFEEHVLKGAEVLKSNPDLFNDTLFCFIENNCFYAIDTDPTKQSLILRDISTNTTRPIVPKTDKPIMTRFTRYVTELLQIWVWRGRSSNAYGLLKVDADVIRALRDGTGIVADGLAQNQLLEYHAAKEWRNKNYEKYAPPKPVAVELSKGNHRVYKQGPGVQTQKPKLALIIIGNVDAGKSTTTGHLISELGFLDDRVIKAYESDCRSIGRESFKFAWVMDKLKRERELGLTIEVGFWNIATENFNIDIIDAPGHRNFVKNMSVGASMSDAAILIVSAAQGEFEAGIMKGGMTREESIIAYASGVRQFIIAVNKMDTVQYKQERFNEVTNEMINILQRYGIQRDKICSVPISGFYGDNLISKSSNPSLSWWTGYPFKKGEDTISVVSLIHAIDTLTIPPRPVSAPLRIPVQNVFKVTGVGTVAVGRVASGTLKNGETVCINTPAGIKKSVVGSIEITHSKKAEVMAGDLVAFNVKGVSIQEIWRGMVVSDPNNQPASYVKLFTAQIAIINHPGQLKVGYTPMIYCHTCNFTAKWVKILQKMDKKTGKALEDNPPFLKNGDIGIVEIEPTSLVELELFK